MSIYNPDASDQYCSECFLKLWRQRLLDINLTPGNQTNYLVDQFSKLQANCSTSMPYTTSAPTLALSSATLTAVTTTAAASAMTTCAGQSVVATNPMLTCDLLSNKYNVSTGALRVTTGDFYCQFNSTICLPSPCPLQSIRNGTW